MSAAAEQVIETGCLAVVLVVPVFFDPHTARNFDADKILLLRSIADVIFAALLIWSIEAGARVCIDGTLAWRAPIVLAMLLVASSYCVSTVLSIAPRISFWGTYFRAQGTYTHLSYAILFAAIVLALRRPSRVEWLVTMILLASVPAAIYACVQAAGRDPIDWALGEMPADRVFGPLGNPIFFSAYMIMVIPLTLARLLEQLVSLQRGLAPAWSLRHLGKISFAASYAALFVLQAVTVFLSQSRGPLLGLAAGLVVFLLAGAALVRRRRMIVAAGMITAVVSIGLLLVFLPDSRILRRPAIDATAKVRVLIWEGASRLFAAQPRRTIFGYGPETIGLVYAPFYSPEIAAYEKRRAMPDRAHNQTFDALIATGIVGCAVQTFLFLSLFYCILRWLGLIKPARDARMFITAVSAGGLGGGVLPYFLDGSTRFSGVGLPFGILTGLMFFLTAKALGQREDRQARRPSAVLLAAVLAAIVAHYVEIQVGVETVSTQLYLAVYAAVAVAIGGGAIGSAADRNPQGNQDAELSVPLPHAAMVGLLLISLTYAFSLPSLNPQSPRFVLLWLFGGTWLGGGVLMMSDAASQHRPGVLWTTRLRHFIAISLGLWIAFAAFHSLWITWRPPPDGLQSLRAMAAHVSNTVSTLYFCVLSIVVIPGFIRWRRQAAHPPLYRRSPLVAMVYGLLVMAAAAAIVTTNLNGARADAFARIAASFERAQRWREASDAYDDALRLQPAQEMYSAGRARVQQALGALPGN